jgi:hypothetical protein
LEVCGKKLPYEQTWTINKAVKPYFPSTPNESYDPCETIPLGGSKNYNDGCGGTGTDMSPDDDYTGCSSPVPVPGEPNKRCAACDFTRTWTATGACAADTATLVQTITLLPDVTGPVFDIATPISQTIECGGTIATPLATDACIGLLPSDPVTGSDGAKNSVDCTDSNKIYETYQRTWIATDQCDNTSPFVQTIYLKDSTPPVLTAPDATTITCPQKEPDATAEDCYDTHPKITYITLSSSPGEDCPTDNILRTITRKVTAKDKCNNEATKQQTITVMDDADPTIACPADQMEGFGCTVPISIPYGVADAADTCALASVTPQCCVEGGIFKRTWTATDACGKTSTCTQQVKITDGCDTSE